MHGGLSPDLNSLEEIKEIMRPTDVPDTGLLCDLLWADPDKDIMGWGENDRGVRGNENREDEREEWLLETSSSSFRKVVPSSFFYMTLSRLFSLPDKP